MAKSYRLNVLVDSLAMRFLTPLDGSLAGMLYGGRIADTLDLPIDESDGVMLSSFPIFKRVMTAPTVVLRNMQRSFSNAGVPDYMRDMKGSHSSTLHSKSPHYHRGTTNEITYPLFGEISYFFTGDIAQVTDTLMRNLAIGTWTSRGYGALLPFKNGSYVEVEECDLDLCGIFGLVDGKPKLVRPVPIRMAQKLGVAPEDYSIIMGRYANPYNPEMVRLLGNRHSTEPVAVPKFAFQK